jgi:hypothetical protein
MQKSAELARFMHNPGLVHAQAALHLLSYVKGSMDEALVYRQDPAVTHDTYGFVGFVDADYAPDYGDEYRNHKSTTGWIFTQNNTALSWRSRKQPVLADSTAASEFLAAADASKHAVWLRRLYADLGYPQFQPSVLFEDNESCMKLVRNYCGHDRIKHLDIRASLVREHYEKGFITMRSVPDRDQLADVFTKVKPGPQNTRLQRWMLRGEVPDDCSIQHLLYAPLHRS